MLNKILSLFAQITPHLKYARYVAIHKWFVAIECFKVGLYWRGIIHDWTKLLPDEWVPYALFFYGKKDEPEGVNGQRRGYYHQPAQPGNEAFDLAWNLHQKRQPHHWQFWLLFRDNGDVLPLEMPEADLQEMICDWKGAGRTQFLLKEWARQDQVKALRKAGEPIPVELLDPIVWTPEECRKWYLANHSKIQLHIATQMQVLQKLRILYIELFPEVLQNAERQQAELRRWWIEQVVVPHQLFDQ